MLFAMVSGLMNGANAVNFIYFTVTGILSLIITIKLFEKENLKIFTQNTRKIVLDLLDYIIENASSLGSEKLDSSK